jgi:putative Holliday junction resolvase
MLKGNRLLALDVGSRRIGVAVSDHAGMLAHPHSTLEAKGPRRDAQAVATLCTAEEAAGVVLGLPAHADGSESTSAARVRKLAAALEALGLAVDFQDEWGTTLAAKEAMAHRVSRKRPEKGLIDQAAAVAILEIYLETRQQAAARSMTPHG